MKKFVLLAVLVVLSWGQSIHSVGGAMDNRKNAKYNEEELKGVDNSYRMTKYTSSQYYKADILLQMLVALDRNYVETPKWLNLLLDYHLVQYGTTTMMISYEQQECLKDVWTLSSKYKQGVASNDKPSPYINKYAAILMDAPRLLESALPECLIGKNGKGDLSRNRITSNIGGDDLYKQDSIFNKNSLKELDKQYRMIKYTVTDVYKCDSLLRALVALDKKFEETPNWLNVLINWHISLYPGDVGLDGYDNIHKQATDKTRDFYSMQGCLMNMWELKEYTKEVSLYGVTMVSPYLVAKGVKRELPNAHVNKYTAILLDKPDFFEQTLPDCIKNFQAKDYLQTWRECQEKYSNDNYKFRECLEGYNP